MSLTYLAGATPRLIDADKRLAAALATIRRARGTERPDPPPGVPARPSRGHRLARRDTRRAGGGGRGAGG